MKRLQKDIKANKKGALQKSEFAKKLLAHLEDGNKARSFDEFDSDEFSELNKELRLLSAKEIIYGAKC